MTEDPRYRIECRPHIPGLGRYVIIDKMLARQVHGPDTFGACQRWVSRHGVPKPYPKIAQAA